MARLPFQRSAFAELHRSAALLDVADVLPGGRLGAHVSETGDLHLDHRHVDLVCRALAERLTSLDVARFHDAHQLAWLRMVDQTDVAASLPADVDAACARAALAELGRSVAAVVPYGLLAKFVPDVLLEHRAFLNAPPPHPSARPGLELATQLTQLVAACRPRLTPGDTIDLGDPTLDRFVDDAIRRFCREHRGHGPLAWHVPAWEDPVYVARAVVAALRHPDRRVVTHSSTPAPAAATDGPVAAWVAWWATFLELESLGVRRAFFVGMVPLVRRIAEHDEVNAAGLLLIELNEVVEGFDPALVRRRLAEWPGGPARLHTMVSA